VLDCKPALCQVLRLRNPPRSSRLRTRQFPTERHFSQPGARTDRYNGYARQAVPDQDIRKDQKHRTRLNWRSLLAAKLDRSRRREWLAEASRWDIFRCRGCSRCGMVVPGCCGVPQILLSPFDLGLPGPVSLSSIVLNSLAASSSVAVGFVSQKRPSRGKARSATGSRSSSRRRRRAEESGHVCFERDLVLKGAKAPTKMKERRCRNSPPSLFQGLRTPRFSVSSTSADSRRAVAHDPGCPVGFIEVEHEGAFPAGETCCCGAGGTGNLKLEWVARVFQRIRRV
jgi:hypothetical protein